MPLTTLLARLLRRLLLWLRSAGNLTLFSLALLRDILDRRPTIRSLSTLQEKSLGPKIAILCHFDRAGRLREDLRHYIRELARVDFTVILVSNSPRLDSAAEAFAAQHCAGVVRRRNVGFDFGAWKDALAACDLPRPETTLLLLANDSLYGPVRPLLPALSRLDFAAADIWGLTDSWQRRYHLQSYLLIAGPAAFNSPAWGGFWRNVRPLASKHWVIRRYEIGFSQAMLRAGFRLGALWPYRALLETVASLSNGVVSNGDDPLDAARARQLRRIRTAIAGGQPLNPTSDLWRVLISQGFPFIKRELLRDNPTRIADLFEWRTLLAGISEIDAAEIEADLARSVRNRAP